MAVLERITSKRPAPATKFFEPTSVSLAHEFQISWASIAGANKAEVTQAALTISPAMVAETFDDVRVTDDNGMKVVALPPKKFLKALALVGLKQQGQDAEIKAEGDLAGRRLTVAFPAAHGGWDAPRFSVPAVSRQNFVPATLLGASFSDRLYSLNESVFAGSVRVALVTGNNASDFQSQAIALSKAHVTTETPARNLKVFAPDDTVLWRMPELPADAPDAEVDLRLALEQAFNKKLANCEQLVARFHIEGDEPSAVFLDLGRVSGALLRVHEGVLTTELAGDPVQLDLGTGLAPTAPSSVTGDLAIRYDGIRILETLSDALPSPSTAISGLIVDAAGALRAFPPEGSAGVQPARIGVVGRASEECELALEFVEAIGDTAGESLGLPALVMVTPASRIETHWAEVSAPLTLANGCALRVRANRGRFLWAAVPQPLVRVAIHDPDPGGRPLFLGGTLLANVTMEKSHEPARALPAQPFVNQPPLLASDLFLTVDVSDLTLRYAR